MNSTSVTPTWFETVTKLLSQVLPCFQRQHQVHPLNTNAGRNKFVQLSTQRRIRIVHVNSRKLAKSDSLCRKRLSWDRDNQNGDKRPQSIVSNTCDNSEDDYWFTRWTQPLRISNNCNCSFKRHSKLRDSKLPQLSQAQSEDQYDVTLQAINSPLASVDGVSLHFPVEATNSALHIRAFAIDFIQDIIDDAVTHITVCRPVDGYHFTANTDYSQSNIPSKCVYCKDNNHVKKPCEENCCEEQQSTGFSLSEIQDSEVLDVGDDFNQSKDRSTDTGGCVNMSFLCTPPDSPTNVIPTEVKSCSHKKKVAKPLLFFLHGVGSSADIWWGLLRYFVSAGYDVLAPDMLGHGYSTAPDQASAYTFQRLLKDTVDIFDKFVGEHGKCVVIGHAYGCSLAAAVARYRTQVTQLVLISGGGPTPLAPCQQPPMFPCVRGCIDAFLFCGFKRDVLYAPCGKQMTSCAALSSDIPGYVLRHVARGQDWPEGDSTFHRRILVPTLLVHGLRDPHVTLVQECEMERTIPRSFLELIPNAGHLAMLETPAQLSHMINCFIEWWSR